MKQVCLKTASWIFVLMLIVPGSVLHAEDPPSSQDQTVRDGQPASTVPVPPALRQALAGSLSTAVWFGAKAIPAPPAGSWGIVSEGDGGGGIFRDTDSDAEAWLGAEEVGVHGFGTLAGGHFEDSDATGYAWVGHSDAGIEAGGTLAGGLFVDSDDYGEAWVGHGNLGIEARGAGAGGYFEHSEGSSHAWVARGGGYGIEAVGTAFGGRFKSSDGSGLGSAGLVGLGIQGFGTQAGGSFHAFGGSGYSYVGFGDRGIDARGEEMGGYFKDSDGSGFAHLGWGNTGVFGRGNVAGGTFDDGDGSGYARVGYGDRGVDAGGSEMGGYFSDSDGTAYANVGYDEYGIEAHGNLAGGFFKDKNGPSHAYVGYGSYGIRAGGSSMGGFFEDLDGDNEATLAGLNYGIVAKGVWAGGLFVDTNGTGRAWVGQGDYGITASGFEMGGHFLDDNESGYAYVGSGHRGIWAFGDGAGGHFEDLDEGTYANVAIGTYSIEGNGTKAFVQNHPYDRDSVIVYAAPEGDEVATYTRGTARLVDGEATVPLGETFKWVTNPDLGLTAFLTPVSEWCDLYVVEQATDSIVVRSRDGSDCAFNFMIYGLRIGFEELSIVQEKEQESYIPSMADHRQLYERRPDLKTYNSLERFKGMRHAINPKAKLDLSRAHALRDAIIEFDPAVHELPKPPGHEERPVDDPALEEAQRGAVQRVRTARADRDRRLAPGHSAVGSTIPVDGEGNVYAPSFRPSSQDLASLVTVSETVEPGDVLVIDTDRRGLMRRGSSAADNGVVGIVAAAPGVFLGSEVEVGQTEAPAEREQNSDFQLKVPVAFSGVVDCKVDASYGAVWTGNLLVTSPTPGHAMAQQAPLPGTVLGKALEPLEKGVGTIKVLVMLR